MKRNPQKIQEKKKTKKKKIKQIRDMAKEMYMKSGRQEKKGDKKKKIGRHQQNKARRAHGLQGVGEKKKKA